MLQAKENVEYHTACLVFSLLILSIPFYPTSALGGGGESSDGGDPAVGEGDRAVAEAKGGWCVHAL